MQLKLSRGGVKLEVPRYPPPKASEPPPTPGGEIGGAVPVQLPDSLDALDGLPSGCEYVGTS